MTGPDKLIEATMRTIVGRVFWAVLSLAVIYACLYYLAALLTPFGA